MAETSMYLDNHSYSLFDPEEIHADLRADPARATAVLARSPQIAAAHQYCEQCQQIRAEQAADPQTPSTRYATLDDAIVAHSERSTRLVLSRARLASVLGLGPGERIARMYVGDDPQVLNLIVAGEHFQPVPDGQPTPLFRGERPTR